MNTPEPSAGHAPQSGASYHTIIWDLDGTLMDTLLDLMSSVNHALEQNGLAPRTYDEIRRFVGNGVRRLVELSVPGGSSNECFEQVFADFKAYYIVHCQDQTGLYAGIAQTLAELHRRGIRMAVVSNKLQAGVTELIRSQVHTVGCSDSICLGDYLEVAIGERPNIARKPAPDMVRLALDEMGIKDKQGVVYIGDSEVDLATARNAGLPCLSVLWGFRDREYLMQEGATTLVATPDEILGYMVG